MTNNYVIIAIIAIMPKYNDDILNYYNDDTHVGSLDDYDKNVGTGFVGSPSCGDVMKLQIKVSRDEKNGMEIITDAKFLVFGCGSAKASSSYVAKQLIGKTVQEAMQIKNTDIANSLQLPKIKLHCSVLAEGAIRRAIDNYRAKNSRSNGAIHDALKAENLQTQDKQIMMQTVNVEITKDAVLFIQRTLSKIDKPIIGIRLCLETGNCGLMYKVRYVVRGDNLDSLSQICIDGINIFFKNDEAEILNGTKIDYKEEGLKRGLIFINKHETGRCSCGQNFFIDKK